MIEYDNQFESAEVQCDAEGCTKWERIDGSFQRVVEEIKSEGWRIKNYGGEWTHYCPLHADVRY